MPTRHTHSLDVTVTGHSRFRQRDPKRDGLGALAALLLAALIAGTDNQGPLFVMTPAQIAFAPSIVGAAIAGPQPLVLQNRGVVPIAFERLIPSQAGLVTLESANCPERRVPAGGQCVVTIAITPPVAGPLTATLALDGAHPAVQLTGQGLPPEIVVARGNGPSPGRRGGGPRPAEPEPPKPEAPKPQPKLEPTKPEPPPKVPTDKTPLLAEAHFTKSTFGAQADVDAMAPVQVALRNTGKTAIATVTFRFEGGHAGDFAPPEQTCALGAPQQECPVHVTFRPREAGEHRAVLIAEAGGAELDRTSLIGTANPPRRPQAEPLPASLQFSKRGERRYVLIYNKGTAALKLGAVSVDNPKDFEIDTKPCTDAPNSSSLDAEKSCPIFVTYNGRRQASGRLTVPHNDPSSPTVITLSAAGAPIEVPKLSGSKRDEALRKLRDKSLVAGTISEEPRCHDIGEVVAQSPEPRTRVPQGTAVDFTLSSMGKDPAQVPALIGQPRASAMSTLQTARLKLGQTTTSETDKFPPGSVIRTNPQAGTPLAPGCDVNLVLAVAIPKFPMPNVVGLTYASAQGRLSAFTASVQGGPVPRGEESRWVVTAQSPQEGTMLTRGTSVDITVTRPGGPSGDDVGTKPAQRPIRPGINVKQPPVNTP